MNAESWLTDEQRRRNRNFGLALGFLSIALTVIFIIIFTRRHLPMDPSEWKRLEAQRQAHSAAPDAEPSAR